MRTPPARPSFPRKRKSSLLPPGSAGEGRDGGTSALLLTCSPFSSLAASARYYLTDANYNVLMLVTDAGYGVERVFYTAYGEPEVFPFGDADGDYDVDTADETLITSIKNSTDPYNILADLNLDGAVTQADLNVFSNYTGYSGGRGVLTISNGSATSGNDIGYAGYTWNDERSQWHVRHREYDPRLGRWLQRDPIGYAEVSNLYDFVFNNPAAYRDPMGLTPPDFRPGQNDPFNIPPISSPPSSEPFTIEPARAPAPTQSPVRDPLPPTTPPSTSPDCLPSCLAAVALRYIICVYSNPLAQLDCMFDLQAGVDYCRRLCPQNPCPPSDGSGGNDSSDNIAPYLFGFGSGGIYLSRKACREGCQKLPKRFRAPCLAVCGDLGGASCDALHSKCLHLKRHGPYMMAEACMALFFEICWGK